MVLLPQLQAFPSTHKLGLFAEGDVLYPAPELGRTWSKVPIWIWFTESTIARAGSIVSVVDECHHSPPSKLGKYHLA